MLCGCQGDRWLIWCLMADEVERGFNNAGLFCSFVWHFNDVCVGFYFADDDMVVGGF